MILNSRQNGHKPPKLMVGTSDFKELYQQCSYFVDKSLLIREILDSSKCTLFPRPRRFGKTLNLSMLRYFFQSGQHVDHHAMFEGLLISRDQEAMTHQGRYPVIYLSLKDIKAGSWEEAQEAIAHLTAELYNNVFYLHEALSGLKKKSFQRILDGTASITEIKNSLADLIRHLYQYHSQPVIVLIDEYDTPVIEAWKNGYYEEMLEFYRCWLGAALKYEESPALFRAVITGILRVAKESLFSSLNNLKVSSCLKPDSFSDKFGFTQAEVDKLLDDFQLPELSEPIRDWYNGYDFGGITIYNPWSVVNAVDEHPATLGPKWLNTASNHLVFEELEAGGLDLREDLEKLLNRQELRYPINDSIVFSDIARGQQNIWSFLYYAGYLKADQPQPDPLDKSVTTWRLQIPNNEISVAYKQFIEHIYASARLNGLKPLLDCFIKDYPAEMLQRVLQDLMLSMTSYHDTARWPEAVFHSFVLGLLAGLREVYEIHSNPEAGYGRADILMIPKTRDYPLGYVIEFKAIKKEDQASMEQALEEAFAQIEARDYAARLREAGTSEKNIRRMALILCGKRVLVGIANQPAG